MAQSPDLVNRSWHNLPEVKRPLKTIRESGDTLNEIELLSRISQIALRFRDGDCQI
jgi:hypothetical protein